ncbi:MAG: hypothetical protein K9K75_02450 [Deltaproteobacteria bacterium]|nr:hypothetical protein [Deltaproteobacteria bacterium]
MKAKEQLKQKRKPENLSSTELKDGQATQDLPPFLKNPLLLTVAAIIISYILVFLGRYILLPWWDNPAIEHCGEPAQITNDAFLFLAGADGFGRGIFENFSTLTRFFHEISGVNYGVLGIWLPVILVPLIAIPICWLFFLMGHPFAGVFASVFMLNAPSFFGRSIPGYYDNDMFDLFFPIAFGAALMVVLSHVLRDKWWKRGGKAVVNTDSPAIATHKLWGYALFAGIVAAAYLWCYPARMPVPFVMACFSTVVGFFVVRQGERLRFAGSMAIVLMIFTLPLYFSLPFALLAIAIAYFKPRDCEERKIGYYLLGFFVLALIVGGHLEPIWEKIAVRLAFFGAGGEGIASVRTAIPVPSFSVSVSEIQRVPFAEVMEMTAYHAVFFVAGAIGATLMFVMRPNAMSFFPIFILGIGTQFLGVRFAIFGCLIFAIGFSYLLAELLSRVIKKKIIPILTYAVLALLVCFLTLKSNMGFPPILSKPFAEALCEVRGKAEKGSQLWAWWDWGHPITYYARVLPFVDGGINELGCYIMAVVYMAETPHNAASVIRYASTTQAINAINNRERKLYDKDFNIRYGTFGYNMFDPLMPIHHLHDAKFLDKTLQRILAQIPEKPQALSGQYLALTWDNMRFAQWVAYFGKWDTRNLVSPQHVFNKLAQGVYNFDQLNGIIVINNRQVRIKNIDVIGHNGVARKSFPNREGLNMIKNDLTGELYISDDVIYRSMMYRMLVENPRNFAEHFELVVDKYPFARIYRLKG